MEAQGDFDFKSDLDFPSLSSNSAPPKKTTSPKEKTNVPNNKPSRDNSRGKCKKQNWKAVHVEFNNNNSELRYQPRGNVKPRFGSPHVSPKNTDDDSPCELSYRGYRSGIRSRIRRGRGSSAPHHYGRTHSSESSTPLSDSPTFDQNPNIVAIPYHPNFVSFVQPHVANAPFEASPVNIEEAIRHQIEYYFSEENLIKDNYMRLNMSSEGFLSIQLISTFNKIKQFNVDIDTIAKAIEVSDKLEVVDGKIVRPIIDPLRWPLKSPLPPPVSTIMPSFVQPDLIVAPIPSDEAMYPDVISEPGDLVYQPIELVADGMLYQNVDQQVENITDYMENITLKNNTLYSYPQCYSVEAEQMQAIPQETVCQDFDPLFNADSPQEIDQTDTVANSQPEEDVNEELANSFSSPDLTNPKVITGKVTYAIYSSDSSDIEHADMSDFQQDTMRCQQDVGHYQQHMPAYVST